MGKSKIIFNGQTLIDLTGDTVTAEALLEGITAHGADGEAILGTLKAGGATEMLSGTFTPAAKTKTVSLGQSLDLSGNYMLFICLIPPLSATMSGYSHFMHAGSTALWNGEAQNYARCCTTFVYTNTTQNAWTLSEDGTVTLPDFYYNSDASLDMGHFTMLKYNWYFIKG